VCNLSIKRNKSPFSYRKYKTREDFDVNCLFPKCPKCGYDIVLLADDCYVVDDGCIISRKGLNKIGKYHTVYNLVFIS
jgi:hypothetical protein